MSIDAMNTKKSQTESEIDLIWLGKIILSKIWVVMICTLVCALLSFTYAKVLVTPQYQTSVSLYVSNTESDSYADVNSQDLTTSRSLIDTYIVILENVVVENALSDYMLTNYDNDLLAKAFTIQEDESGNSYISTDAISSCVTLSSVDETEVLQITSTTSNAEVSAIVCNSYAAIAPEYLTRIVKAGSVETIGAAIVPKDPVSPNELNYTAIGACIGILLALAYITCIELFNNKIRSAEDIAKKTDRPVIGEIAAFADDKKKLDNKIRHLLTSEDTPFYIMESYKALCTNFLFSVGAAEEKIVVLTSANSGEGKSTTASNLAISLAQLGHKVLLIDGDLRKPVQHTIFDLDNSGGLSTWLCGIQELNEILQKNVIENLDVLPAGVIPPNPTELLGSKKMHELLEQVSTDYDNILIDAPPLNCVSDSLAINGNLAGLLLVTRYNSTRFEDISRAEKAIELADLNILGFVLNGIDVKHSNRYYKSYYRNYAYGYGQKHDRNQEKRKTTE